MAIIQIEKEDGSKVFPYLEIFILMLMLKFIFDQYLNYRQLLKYKIKIMPKEIQELQVFTKEDFAKSQEYSHEKLEYKIFVDVVETVIGLILLKMYANAYFWTTAKHMPFVNPTSEYQVGVAFCLILIAFNILLDLPFSLYRVFVIEEKFGFNKYTYKLFFLDELKQLVITVTILFVFLKGFLWVVEWGGELFFIYLQAFITVFMLGMIFIYPNYIAPWFNKFEELEEGTLKERIYAMANKRGFPLKKIYIIDGSKRTNHSNAYFFGIGKNKRIVLYDTLKKHCNEEQITAILCHELGHWHFSHNWKNIVFSLMNIQILLFVFKFFRESDELFLSFGFSDKSVLIGITLFQQMYSPILFLSGLLALKMSRKFEFQADLFACQQQSGQALKSGLIALHKENKSNLINDELYASFNYSHPTLLERVKHIDLQLKND